MEAELIRTDFELQQTTGEFIVYGHSGNVIFEAKSLELDVDGNRERESCIPEGSYNVIPLINRPESARFTKEKVGYFPYLVQDVPNRSGILFHHGNYHEDILGCILLGQYLTDINGDGLRDVTSSRNTMQQMNSIVKEPFTLEVYRNNPVDRITSIPNIYT